MLLSDWIRRTLSTCNVLSSVRLWRQCPRRARRRAGLTRGIQALEDRTLLSSFTVTTNGDAGSGSLRQAVLDANANPGADEIVFQQGLSGEIDLTSGQISITQDVTIIGNGRNLSIIDAQNASRIFLVSTPAHVTITGLTLKNGNPGANIGGAILHSGFGGSISVLNCTFANNTAALNGGGAIATDDAAVVISGSSFSSNTASAGNGGAIFSDGAPISIANSTFSGNVTEATNRRGGAVYRGATGAQGNVVISNSTFTTNQVKGAGSEGGAIAISGTGTLLISDSTLSGNVATDDGGAIYTLDAHVQISGSTLSGNTGDQGGGIRMLNSADLSLTNSTLSGNTAVTSGGGLQVSGDLMLLNSTITLNTSTGAGGGGGLHLVDADNVTVRNSILAANTSSVGPDTNLLAFGGVLTIQNSLIGRNNTTGLTATAGTTPDSNGNFVGGATAGTAIAPLLGPLQNNGGVLSTHAILSNSSLAFNTGNNFFTAGVPTDQRGFPYSRIRGLRVDMGAYEAPAPTLTGNSAEFNGTSGSDAFSHSIGGPGVGSVTTEGFTYNLSGFITTVLINGLGGSDSWTVDTPPGNDRLILNPASHTHLLDLANNGSFDITASGMENVIATDASGGGDVAILNDSAGDDVLVGSVNFVRMTGGGYQHLITGFESVSARSNFTSDFDAATFDDSPGADRFIPNPTGAALLTSGFALSTTGFSQVTAIADAGIDRALFRDTAGVDDTLIATAIQTQRLGSGFDYIAIGFDTVAAQSVGSNDVALLAGDANADALTARPGVATFSSAAVNMTLEGFSRIDADGKGGVDFLRFYGSAGDDTFAASPISAQMTAAGFEMRGANFETMIGISQGGNDTALLFDSTGDDTFLGFSTTAQLRGPGSLFTQRAFGFTTVSIIGTAGGVNMLSLSPPLGYQLFQVGSWT